MKTPVYILATLLASAQLYAQEPVTEPTVTPESSSASVSSPANTPEAVSQPPADPQPTPSDPSAQPVQAQQAEQATQAPTPQQGPAQALPPEANTPVQAEAQAPVQAEASPEAQSTPPADKASPEPQPASSTQVSADNQGSASAGVNQADGSSASVNTSGSASATTSGGTTASVNSSGGASVSSGSLSVGLMELDGQSVTRISYRPEFAFGKLGVALDVELFIDSDGNFLSEGWEFDTQNQILNTIYRKIYYVRWDQPGAPFYARVGALEGLGFDAAGLVMSGWGNVANYPSQKLLGVHTQINESITPFAISLDAATNSVLDWNNGGGVIALKAGFAPIATLPLPILNGLRLNATYVSDLNQKAAIPDRDDDGCPDDLDAKTSNSAVCTSMDYDISNIIELEDQAKLDSIDRFYQEVLAQDEVVKRDFAKKDDFTLIAFDALLPLWNTEFSSLNLFAEYAQPYNEEGLDDAYGLVPFGANGHISIINWGLQYRILNSQFSPAHFDAAYEMQRMVFDQGKYVSKQKLYWSEDRGYREGIYGTLGIDLWGVANVGGSYSHLMSAIDTIPDDKAYSATAGLGQTVLSFIPKVSKAEVFFSKTRVGQDKYTLIDPDGGQVLHVHDGFFQKSKFATWGFTIGSDLGGGLQLNVTRATTFEREFSADGTSTRLVPNDNFYAETVLSF